MFQLYDVILPRRCIHCKSLIRSGVFCGFCQTLLKRIDASGDEVESVYAYTGLLRQLIVQAKFGPDESLSKLLCRQLQNDIATQEFGRRLISEHFSAVTYVPSHWRRRFQRGHIFPGLLAQTLSRFLKVPLHHVLTCARHDPPLSKAHSTLERRNSLNGRFRATAASFPGQAHLLLVDDITTTGSTLEFCSKELQLVGYSVKSFAFAKRLLSNTKEN